MAVKPALLIPWDSGGVNLVAVTGTHQTNGFANSEIPTSGEQNTWQQNTYLWLLWLLNNIGTIVRDKFPTPLATGVWTVQPTFSAVTRSAVANTTTGGPFYVDLDVPNGYKVSTITLGLRTAGGANPIITVTLEQAGNTFVPTTVAATLTVATPTGSSIDAVLNMLAASGAQNVTVAAAGGTYTRAAGSFITDGFFVGQQVQFAGFANGGNNALKTITVLTATVMTVSTTGLVNETSVTATTTGVSPTADGTFALLLGVATAGGVAVNAVAAYSLRYTLIPQ